MVHRYFSIGLMSGSSLDGLDICYNSIMNENENYTFKILAGETTSFTPSLYNQLKNIRSLSEEDLNNLDWELGHWMAKETQQFILRHNINNVQFIASHGHTVYHFPHLKKTKQIGNGQAISNGCHLPVINNFREIDILHGGQGAPIVPLADLLFFPNIKYCLNLGGIMNISIKTQDSIHSSDIGVCNQCINYFAEKLGCPYDKNGEFARQGKWNKELFDALNNHTFFSLPFPKSLDNSFSKILITCCEEFSIPIPDILHTFYTHIVFQITRFVNDKESILITGGGSHNIFLMELIKEKKLNLYPIDKNLIDQKESLAMSLMGVRFLENKYNVLASVTGAEKNTINGRLYNPQNY